LEFIISLTSFHYYLPVSHIVRHQAKPAIHFLFAFSRTGQISGTIHCRVASSPCESFHERGRSRETAARRIPTEKFRVAASVEASFSRFPKRVACPGLLSRQRLLLVKIALSTWVSGNLRGCASRCIVSEFSTYANFVGEGGRWQRKRGRKGERARASRVFVTASASIAQSTPRKRHACCRRHARGVYSNNGIGMYLHVSGFAYGLYMLIMILSSKCRTSIIISSQVAFRILIEIIFLRL